jgi:cytochrome P450
MTPRSGVSMTSTDIYWDPYDREIYVDPYETYRRLRDEAPLYFNEEHGFYAISRYADTERMLQDRDTFLSGKGTILPAMKSDQPVPPGLFIFEDPPFHTFHRARLSRVFTVRAVNQLEAEVRDFCRRSVEALAGRKQFDMMDDLAREIPMRVMGMLLGIPDAEQPALRDHFIESMHRPAGMPADQTFVSEAFGEYLDYREQHETDDLMSRLLHTQFEDETGATRGLSREELVTYINLIAAAGNDTTGLLIGWVVKLLGDHPDQRAELAADASLIPAAIEEVLRCENPAYSFGRYVAADAEFHGRTVPAGSFLLCVAGSPNRDERQYGPTAEVFDIHRKIERHISFGYGSHFCLGASLARLEARLAVEEIMRVMPVWQVDEDRAALVPGGATRGWAHLPVEIG